MMECLHIRDIESFIILYHCLAICQEMKRKRKTRMDTSLKCTLIINWYKKDWTKSSPLFHNRYLHHRCPFSDPRINSNRVIASFEKTCVIIKISDFGPKTSFFVRRTPWYHYEKSSIIYEKSPLGDPPWGQMAKKSLLFRELLGKIASLLHFLSKYIPLSYQIMS
jgi:hypothetical protein